MTVWQQLRPKQLGLDLRLDEAGHWAWFAAAALATAGNSPEAIRALLAACPQPEESANLPPGLRETILKLKTEYGSLTALAESTGNHGELLRRLGALPGFSAAAARLFLRELWSLYPQARPPFGSPAAYDAWFSEHPTAYQAELAAVASRLPGGTGVEIGVGTGRFAGPLGVRLGVEPSPDLAVIARERGLEVEPGTAEALPLPSERFDFALMITVLCFAADPEAALAEIHRVLKPKGSLLLGLIDPETPLGRRYVTRQATSVFYRSARFRPVPEVVALAQRQGFRRFSFAQALFGSDPDEMDDSLPVARTGFGQGGFAVVRADR